MSLAMIQTALFLTPTFRYCQGYWTGRPMLFSIQGSPWEPPLRPKYMYVCSVPSLSLPHTLTHSHLSHSHTHTLHSLGQQVGTNGVISFGRPFYFWYSQKFPTRYPWIRDTYVAAPLWMDMDMRSRGYVIYTTLKIGESPSVFESVNTFMVSGSVIV